ncbi:helix-turn-helix protein [Gemmata sp. SH-PL17]|uniref:helix-turn-helix transcriptional regulator n=1 Tax=Gemmata sp. SH-PL17 TaxID=1630693 RepID=UPI00078D8692|nr:helix-turn-helix transcriptional regulator [Gemmata sp. SH-PL17]AMV24121.1 helix-turn-helix protein [Gemmata sp. SH-PL17]
MGKKKPAPPKQKEPKQKPRQAPSAFDSVKLRDLRLTAELSQAALAAAIGLTATDISRYERGLYEPSFTTAVKLATALSVTLDALKRAPGAE